MRWQARQVPGRHPPKVRGPAVPGNYLVAPPKPGRVRLLPGWPVGQSWLQPPVVVLTLSWAWMTRPALAGTAALWRSTGRWLRLRSEGRAQALP